MTNGVVKAQAFKLENANSVEKHCAGIFLKLKNFLKNGFISMPVMNTYQITINFECQPPLARWDGSNDMSLHIVFLNAYKTGGIIMTGLEKYCFGSV